MAQANLAQVTAQLSAAQIGQRVGVRSISVDPKDQSKEARAMWGTVRANLTVVGVGGAPMHFTFAWSQNRPIAWAHVVGPHPATLRFPAP